MIEQRKEFIQGFFIPMTFDTFKGKIEGLVRNKHPKAKLGFIKNVELSDFFKNKTISEKDVIDVISTEKGSMISNHHLFAKSFSRPELSKELRFIEFGCNEDVNGIIKHRFQEWCDNEPSNLSIVLDNPRRLVPTTKNFLNINDNESVISHVFPRLSKEILGLDIQKDKATISRYKLIDYDEAEYNWF